MNLHIVKNTPPPNRTNQIIGQFSLTPVQMGDEIGIATGPDAGIIAVVESDSNRVVHLYRFIGELPPRSREGCTQVIVYGEPVLLGGKWDGSRPVYNMDDQLLGIWKGNLYS